MTLRARMRACWSTNHHPCIGARCPRSFHRMLCPDLPSSAMRRPSVTTQLNQPHSPLHRYLHRIHGQSSGTPSKRRLSTCRGRTTSLRREASLGWKAARLCDKVNKSLTASPDGSMDPALHFSAARVLPPQSKTCLESAVHRAVPRNCATSSGHTPRAARSARHPSCPT